MMRIDVDKIIPSNCPLEREDCIQCGCYGLEHDEIICYEEIDEYDNDCCDNENTH